MSFLTKAIKATENELAETAEGGLQADVTGFIDTGSYALNALLSGSIYGGAPANKILAFAGASATGKTFFALSMAQTFLEDNPKSEIIIFDSEDAITSEMLLARVGVGALALDDKDDEDLSERGVRGASAANKLVFRLLLFWAVVIAALTLSGLSA